MRPILTWLALFVMATPVLACLNDAELPQHEREFRSQYHEQENPPPAPSAEPQTQPGNHLLVGGGAAMLAAAVAVTLSVGPKRS
jgi:hypothetical protein